MLFLCECENGDMILSDIYQRPQMREGMYLLSREYLRSAGCAYESGSIYMFCRKRSFQEQMLINSLKSTSNAEKTTVMS